MAAKIEEQALQYSTLEPEAAPWSGFEAFGHIASREQGLLDRKNVFALVDAITENDRRLSSRILASSLQN